MEEAVGKGNKTTQRLLWVDQLRGFCMVAILWLHTETYYAGRDITPYAFYVGDVIATFFFLSGYLFFSGRPLDMRHKLYGVFRWLVVPYFIFTTLIAIPKAMAHGEFTGIAPLVLHIVSGRASWFIAALTVSQLLFIATLRLTRGHQPQLAILALTALVAASLIGNGYHPSPLYYEQDFWYFNESLLGFSLMAVGYFYHAYEKQLTWHTKTTYLALVSILFLIAKYMVFVSQPKLVFGPLIVSDFPFFVADILVSMFLLVGVFKRLPSFGPFLWTGRRSIAYYFICGGVPFVVSRILNALHFPYNGIFSLLTAFACTYTVSTSLYG